MAHNEFTKLVEATEIEWPPNLRTEKAVSDCAAAIKHDLEYAAQLVMLGTRVIRYVVQHTEPWLARSPATLRAKITELDLALKVLADVPNEVRQEMLREGRLPPVQVITMPKAVGDR